MQPHAMPQPSTARFVFGVDLDGVCANFVDGLRPIAAEWLNVPEETLGQHVSYNFPEWGVPDAPGGYEALHRFAVLQRDLFNRLVPMSGCSLALRRLSQAGVHIRIITHRLFISHFHKDAIRQTMNWLDHHNIPYRDLAFQADKAAVGADLYIEDSPINIAQLRADGHDTLVFDATYNRDLPGPRAHTWEEVETYVRAALKRWEFHGPRHLLSGA